MKLNIEKTPAERAIDHLRFSKEVIDKILATERERFNNIWDEDKYSDFGMKRATKVSNLELVSAMIQETIALAIEATKD